MGRAQSDPSAVYLLEVLYVGRAEGSDWEPLGRSDVRRMIERALLRLGYTRE